MSDNPFDDTPETKDGGDFFNSGSPSCRFKRVGDMHTGIVVSFEEKQQRDLTTGNPKSWPDGNPAMMLVITLQTEERDDEIEDDDGRRCLYVNKPGGMFVAIKTAIGKFKFSPGSKLAVKYVKDGVPKQRGFNAPKEYVAKYWPPEEVAEGSRNGNANYPKTRADVTARQPLAALPETGGPEADSIPF